MVCNGCLSGFWVDEIVKVAVITGWIGRALVILLSLVNSRLLIELVGVDGLAVQSIMISLTSWFALLNLGIPPAVQNMISRYRAENRDYDRLKHTASSLMLVIFVTLLPFVMGLGFIIKFLVLDRYPNVATSSVVAFCVGLFISGLCVLFNQILYAEQRGYWPNLYPAINVLCITGFLIALRSLNSCNINLVLLVFVVANLVVALLGILQARASHMWCLDRQVLADIWRNCRGFALFSLLATSVLGVDYLIMSRFLSAQDIAMYNICQRVFMGLFSVHAIILTSSWPGISETLFAKQWKVARNKVRNLLFIGMGMISVLGGIVFLFMRNIADVISYHKITSIPVTLTLLFLVYMFLRIWSDTYAMALLSCNETKVLNRYVPFQAVISVIAQLLFVNKFGIVGIMMGIIISFLATAVWILPKAFYKVTGKNVYQSTAG